MKVQRQNWEKVSSRNQTRDLWVDKQLSDPVYCGITDDLRLSRSYHQYFLVGCVVKIFLYSSFIIYIFYETNQCLSVHASCIIRQSNCWFSFASAFQLFLLSSPQRLFHLCISLNFMFSEMLH